MGGERVFEFTDRSRRFVDDSLHHLYLFVAFSFRGRIQQSDYHDDDDDLSKSLFHFLFSYCHSRSFSVLFPAIMVVVAVAVLK